MNSTKCDNIDIENMIIEERKENDLKEDMDRIILENESTVEEK